jgi:hypothetical protein
MLKHQLNMKETTSTMGLVRGQCVVCTAEHEPWRSPPDLSWAIHHSGYTAEV